MKAALVIYGSLDSVSGGYLYDRMLVAKLRREGDELQVISQRPRSYAVRMLDNFSIRFPAVDVLIQDELNHSSLFLANHRRGLPPIVSIVHHLRSSERRPPWQNSVYAAVERSYLHSVDGFIFNSETTRESVQRLVGSEKPNVVATPGGNRFGKATPEAVRPRAAQGEALRLVNVGNVMPGKGLDVLLGALEHLRGEPVQLDVIGREDPSPAFAARMRRQAERLGLPVRFHGALSDAELQWRLQSGDALVLPSFYEGFGIVFLEAMMQGLPGIGAAAGAVPSLIRHGLNGFLVEPGDVGQLAQCIRALAQDRELLLRMSLEALRSAGDYPTWDQSTDRIRDFLLSMVRRD